MLLYIVYFNDLLGIKCWLYMKMIIISMMRTVVWVWPSHSGTTHRLLRQRIPTQGGMAANLAAHTLLIHTPCLLYKTFNLFIMETLFTYMCFYSSKVHKDPIIILRVILIWINISKYNFLIPFTRQMFMFYCWNIYLSSTQW